MKPLKLILLIICMCSGFSIAQIEVDDKMQFSNLMDSLRQVENLGEPNAINNAVNVLTFQNNKLLYPNMVSAINDSINLTFNLFTQNYITGTTVYFKSPITNNGSVFISINDLPHLEAVFLNESLDSGEIIVNQAVQLVYNNNAFEVVSYINNPCPIGFIAVDDKYCIEINEHDSITFYDANNTCGNLNARLCSWGEWYNACQSIGGSLNGITGNYEWVDTGGNYVGGLHARVSGKMNCRDAYSILVNTLNTKAYRCCYSRKKY